MTACQNVNPWMATSVAPSGSPRIEMFAANQTQNSCIGWPWRSDSGTGSIPRVSSAPSVDAAALPPSTVVSVMDVSFVGSAWPRAKSKQPVGDRLEFEPVDLHHRGGEVAGKTGGPVAGAEDGPADGGDRVRVATEFGGQRERLQGFVAECLGEGERRDDRFLRGHRRADHVAHGVGEGVGVHTANPAAGPADARGDVPAGVPMATSGPGGRRVSRGRARSPGRRRRWRRTPRRRRPRPRRYRDWCCGSVRSRRPRRRAAGRVPVGWRWRRA